MMAQLEIAPPRNDRRVSQRRHVAHRNLVVVASEPTTRTATDDVGRAPLDRRRANLP